MNGNNTTETGNRQEEGQFMVCGGGGILGAGENAWCLDALIATDRFYHTKHVGIDLGDK